MLKLRPPQLTPARAGAVVALLCALGVTHYLGGAHIGLYTFFVLPCALAAWSMGLSAGLLSAALSAAIVLASDTTTQLEAPAEDLAINAALRLGLYSLVSWGVDTIGALLEQLQEASRTDSLTGLANRHSFLSRGTEEIERARRTLRPFSLLFLDLDGFKSVNDRFGHAAGDALLRRVGAVLRAQMRSIDVPARLGGDEFAVLLPETDGEGARRAAVSLHLNLQREFTALQYPVSASIGAATFPQPPAAFEHAITCADRLMYSVKKGSKDAVAHQNF